MEPTRVSAERKADKMGSFFAAFEEGFGTGFPTGVHFGCAALSANLKNALLTISVIE